MSFSEDDLAKAEIVMAPSKAFMMEEGMHERALDMMRDLCGSGSGSSSAVFFCGGDQVKITEVIYTIPGLKSFFEMVYNNGLPFAGTSAGCAVMSSTMITGEGNFDVIDHQQVETKTGLGFVVNAVLDQHFVARRRLNRLLSVMSGSREIYGIGIDEEMAVAVVDDVYCEVLGAASCVILIEKPERHQQAQQASESEFSIKILRSGDKFEINRGPK
jgi:cyanophycinase